MKYVSEDLSGNTYTVTAQSATLEEDKLNELQLFTVNAEITRENKKLFIFPLKLQIIIKLIIIPFFTKELTLNMETKQ